MTAVEREQEQRSELIRVARRLDSKGILTSTDGNLSARLDDGAILITPGGSCKGLMDPADLIVVQVHGKADPRASSELALHRTVYDERPDVKAIIHAHPPYATAYAVAGIPLDRPILSEVVLTLGDVPLAPYAPPTRDDLAQSIRPYLREHSAILLRHHGVVVFADTLSRACSLMETLEHVAHVDFVTRVLGSDDVLDREQVEVLKEIRGAMRAIGSSGNFPH